MRLRDDDRSQSIQIGAVLLFGILIILLSSYQAFVVPAQNKQVEFKHSQEVRSQLQDLRNAIVSSVSRETSRSVSIDIGTTYPSRIVAVNPPPPSGTLRTAGTGNSSVVLAIDNASASAQETRDIWNGSQRNYSTGIIVYEPSYNVYENAPTSVYGNTVLYHKFDKKNLTATGQTMIDGKKLTLFVLNGSFSTAGTGSVSVDVRPVSSSDNSIRVTSSGSGENVTITFASRLPATEWRDVLESELDADPGPSDGDDKYVARVTQSAGAGKFHTISIVLERGATYRLRMVKVGVGSGVTEESVAYLTEISGEGTSVEQGGTTDVVLEVRDGYNNPEVNVSVNASASAGSFEDADDRKFSNDDGEVTFTYNASGVTAGTTQQLNFSLATIRPDFDQSTAENVTVNVSVTAGGGGGGSTSAYTIAYDEPTIGGETGVTCSGGSCTYDFAKDKIDTSFTLTADTSPTVVGADVDFALNTTEDGTYSSEESTTDNNGDAEAVFAANGTGGVTSYVTSGESSDTLEVSLVDTSKLITALEADTNDDSKYEFVQLYFAVPTDTNGWDINDTAGTLANLPDETLSGKVWFAADGAAFAEKWGLSKENVYNFTGAVGLNNGGDTISLISDTGTTVDKMQYNDNNDEPDDGIVNNVDENEVAYRVKTDGSLPYQDNNDNDKDWDVETETSFFGNAAPSASFTYSPSSPVVGDSITFDASGSSDPNGDSLTYEWDWTNDGTVDDTTTSTTISHTYSSAGTYTVNLTVRDGNGGVDSVTKTVTVSNEPFAAASATSLVPSANDQHQYINFTVGSDMSSTEQIEIKLSDAQSASPERVDYSSASVTLESGPAASSLQFTTQSSTEAVITYSPSSDLSASDTIVLDISNIAVGRPTDQLDPYGVNLTRSDGGKINTTFDVAYSTGSSKLSSVSATDVDNSTTSATQTISFTLSEGLSSGQVVVVDLSDAQNPNAPLIDYINAGGITLTQGSGSVVLNGNSDSAWLVYTAGSGDNNGDTISVEFTGLNATKADETATVTFNVGASREDADTLGDTFELNQKPNADTGGPYTVNESSSVTLDGTASSDPDGSISSYSWTITGGPGTLSDANTATPTYNAPENVDSDKTVTVELTVTDNDGASRTESTRFTVRDKPPEVTDLTVTTGEVGGSGKVDDATFDFETVEDFDDTRSGAVKRVVLEIRATPDGSILANETITSASDVVTLNPSDEQKDVTFNVTVVDTASNAEVCTLSPSGDDGGRTFTLPDFSCTRST